MNLRCNTDLASNYKAGPQIARILSEEWCGRELYCAACDSDRILASRPNTEAIDFTCPKCEQKYQLKSSRSWNTAKIPDAGYQAMIRAIREDRTPNLLLLQYTSEWYVRNLLLVPHVFFTEGVIEERKPLSSTARRAGWVGCNIVLRYIPVDGKISVVSAGSPESKQDVRRNFERIKGLETLTPHLRGWTVEVLNVIRQLKSKWFSLEDVYQFEARLSAVHPRNRNVRPKIRQQLQVLRDLGIVQFLGGGHYALLS